MRANRRIDPASRSSIFRHNVMQRFAHPVQALEFKGPRVVRHMQDSCNGMGIMRRELRINPVGHAQQFAGIGDVADVRMVLGCKHRKAIQPRHLRPLDLGIPIRALDQPHHDLAVQPICQIIEVIQNI